MRDAICKFEFTVSCETVVDQRKVLVTLNIAGTFEEFVQNAANDNP